MTIWTPESWRAFPAKQQPSYNDQKQLLDAERRLSDMPPLVFAEEAASLKSSLALAAKGEAFLLQGGDCAETFADFSSDNIRNLFKVLMQMAVVLTYGGRKPVIKVGRLAGQFAKPRSSDMETSNGVELPSFRGDIINSVDFDAQAREADPQRMLQAYHQSTATLNLVRAFAQGGLADLNQVNEWNLDFVSANPACEQYIQLADRIQDALAFMDVVGINSSNAKTLRETSFYTSHEALLLNYEQALTRKDDTNGKWFNGSAHMLWIGERTRELDGAHIEFLRGVENPLGVKISSKISPDELIELIDTLNPNNEPGRLTLISRMGADNVSQHLPNLAARVAKEGRCVVWSCDPMHGNTVKSGNGYKTRSFDRIMREIQEFFEILKANDQHPGGLHLEMTGAHVTECVGGAYHVSEKDLDKCYQTQCDPRLNAQQVLELSFKVAELMRSS